jgi:hypothetical protein
VWDGVAVQRCTVHKLTDVFKSIDVYCQCGHQVVIDASHLPDDWMRRKFDFRLRCTFSATMHEVWRNQPKPGHRIDGIRCNNVPLNHGPTGRLAHSKLAPLIDRDDVTNYRATRAAVLLTTDP